MQKHLDWFNDYTHSKLRECAGDPSPLLLKIKHSRNVLQNAIHITSNAGLPPHLAHICHVAAIYHDLGRFDQYLQYGTFKDRDSVNHGRLSVKIIKHQSRLDGMDRPAAHAVMAAVGLHNRYSLPAGLPEPILLASRVVRDADKLDILRVMDEHLSGPGPYNPTVVLSLPDDPAIHSPAVIAAALRRQIAAYTDLLSVNDFRLLLGTWFFEMNFAASRRLFLEAGHGQRVLEKLPASGPYAQARAFVLGEFERGYANP